MSEAPARREILSAARRCFARAGYHGTSIKAIAAEAEIRSPSILHYHFANKEALFLAVVQEAMTTLTSRATELGLQGQGPRGLGAVEAFFSLLDEAEDLPALLLQCFAMGARGEGPRGELRELLSGLEVQVGEAIKRLLSEDAEHLPLRPAVLAGAVVDMLTGHALRSTLAVKGAPAPLSLTELRAGLLTLLGLVRPATSKTPEADA